MSALLLFNQQRTATNPNPITLSQTTATLQVGSPISITVSQPNNSTFYASADGEATVSVFGSTVTVIPLVAGTVVVVIEGANRAYQTLTLTALPNLVTVSASIIQLQIGQSVALTVSQNANTANQYSAASNNRSVSVSVADNVVTVFGVALGDCVVIITGADGQTTTVNATVIVSPMYLSATTLSGPIGGTGSVNAAQAYNGTFTAVSDTPAVATVSVMGSAITVAYITEGTANITVTGSGGQQESVAITVSPDIVNESVMVSPTSLFVIVGVLGVFTATQYRNTSFTASSDNITVAQIFTVLDNLVFVESINPGLANITIIGDNGQSDVVQFQVAEVSLTVPDSITQEQQQSSVLIAAANFYKLYGNNVKTGYTVYFTPGGGWAVAVTGTEYLGLIASFVDLSAGYASLAAFQAEVLSNFVAV